MADWQPLIDATAESAGLLGKQRQLQSPPGVSGVPLPQRLASDFIHSAIITAANTPAHDHEGADDLL
jgi:hypothetical protein